MAITLNFSPSDNLYKLLFLTYVFTCFRSEQHAIFFAEPGFRRRFLPPLLRSRPVGGLFGGQVGAGQVHVPLPRLLRDLHHVRVRMDPRRIGHRQVCFNGCFF